MVVVLFLLTGCYPAHVSFTPGWTTSKITGNIHDFEKSPLEKNSIILVQSYYSSFVTLDNQGTIYTPKASLITPDAQGNFSIPFDLNASKLSLSIVTPGHQMQEFFFYRQVGVGDLSYDASMQAIDGWREHFYLVVRPYMLGFITDDRYELADGQKLQLSQWIDKQEQQLHAVSLSEKEAQ